MVRLLRLPVAAFGAAVLAVVVTGCKQDLPAGIDPDQLDAVEAPDLGACRQLTIKDLALPSNASRVVECADRHTAMTYEVGSFPQELADADYDADALGAFAFETCSAKFRELLGADESVAMRTVLTWAWFRPSQKAWDQGARWFRCDVVGGGAQTEKLLDLPADVDGLMQRPGDEWLVCAVGATVAGATRVPCSQSHDWRAVSTIKLGEPDDPYPGDHASETTTRDYCSESVGAWLGYPADYDYGYTWFHEPEWNAGNRRSVCWARTSQ
jgi:hypothetical protein